MGFFKEVGGRFSFTWVIVAVFIVFVIYATVKEKPGIIEPTTENGGKESALTANSAKQQDAKLDADRADLTAKLKSIIVDPNNIVKEGDSVSTVFAKFAEAVQKSDPEGKGINIILIPDRRPAEPAKSTGKDSSLNIDSDDTGAGHTIELIGDLPAIEELRSLCMAAGYKYRMEDHAVVVAPAEAALDFMVTKIFLLYKEEKRAELKKKGGLKKWLQARGIKFPPGARLAAIPHARFVVVRNTPSECAKIRKAFASGGLLFPRVPNAQVTLMEVDIPEREYRAACVNGLPPRDDFWRRAIATGKAKVVSMGQTLSSYNDNGSASMTNDACFPEDWCDDAADQSPPPVPDDDKEKEKGDKKKAEGDDMPPRTARPAILHVIAPEFGEPSSWGTRLEATAALSEAKPYSMTVDGWFVNKLFAGWKRYGETIKMPVSKKSLTPCASVLTPAKTGVINSSVREKRGPSGIKRVRRVSLLTATPIDALKSSADTAPWRPRTNAERTLAKIPVEKFKCDGAPLEEVVKKWWDIVQKASHDASPIKVQLDDFNGISAKKVSLDLTEVSAYDVLRYACLQTGVDFHTTNGTVEILNPDGEVDIDCATQFDAMKSYAPPLLSGEPRVLKDILDANFARGIRQKWRFNELESILSTNRFDAAFITLNARIYECYRIDPQVLVECSIVRMGQKDLETLVGAETARLGGFSEKQLQRILSSPKGHLEMSLSCVTKLSEEKMNTQYSGKCLPEYWSDVTYTTDSDGNIRVIPPVPEFSESTEMGGRIVVTPNFGFEYQDAVRLSLYFASQRMTGKIDYELRAASGAPTDWKGKIWMPILTKMKYEGMLTIRNGQTVLTGWLKTKALPSGGNLTGKTSGARNGLENIFFIAKVDIVAPNGERYPSLEEMLRQSLDSVGLR